MSSFPIVATVISMVLGLSITRLLLGLVTVFRIRRTSSVDWVPLAWCAILFVIQLQYWWAINDLPLLRSQYGFSDFLFLVLMTLMLFVSAALLLPSRSEDEQGGLRAYFETDGSFALLSLSGFLLLASVLNVLYFNEPIKAVWALLDIPMIVLPALAFFLSSRRSYAAITAVYLPLLAVDVWVSLQG